MQGRQAARKQRELAEAGSGRRGAAGLNGCWRERTCQAAIKILRATAALAGFLPARSARSVQSGCQGLVGRQACWAASTAAQRRVLEPALDSAPVRDRSPDWLIFGARPA